MPVAAKRKTAAKDDGSAPKKRKRTNIALLSDFEMQYESVDTLEFEDCGQGSYLFGPPNFTFYSLMDDPMWLGIMSGTNDQDTGAVLFLGPGKGPEDVSGPIFPMPLRNTEQFIIIDEPTLEQSTTLSKRAFRAIFIPIVAVGASFLKRNYPKAVQFKLLDQKAGKCSNGRVGEANDDPVETYRSLITRVINEQLAPYQKTVIDASSGPAVAEDASAAMICYDVVLEHEAGKRTKKNVNVKGQLFFLKTGILFHSPTTVLYLTVKSTPSARLIHNFEVLRPTEPVNLSLICPTSEPCYEGDWVTEQGETGQDVGPERVSIRFTGIDPNVSTSIAQHASTYGMELIELEQWWYSLEQEQPSSGWQPLGSEMM